MTKAHAELQSRGYSLELREEIDGSWTAIVPELPGCVAVGDSPNEAVDELPQVIDLWMAAARDRGLAIPRPRREETANGRVLVRLPRSVHSRLLRASRDEGVTLNSYCVAILTAGLAQALERAHAQPRAAIHFASTPAVQQTVNVKHYYQLDKFLTDSGSTLVAGYTAGPKVVGHGMGTGWIDSLRHIDLLNQEGTEEERPLSRHTALALAT